jgi:hypothetical protein
MAFRLWSGEPRRFRFGRNFPRLANGLTRNPAKTATLFPSLSSETETEHAGGASHEEKTAELPRGGLGPMLSDGGAEALLDPRRWPQMNCLPLDPRPHEDSSIVRVWMREDVCESLVFLALRRWTPEAGWWLDQTFFDVTSVEAESFLRYLGGHLSRCRRRGRHRRGWRVHLHHRMSPKQTCAGRVAPRPAQLAGSDPCGTPRPWRPADFTARLAPLVCRRVGPCQTGPLRSFRRTARCGFTVAFRSTRPRPS